MSQSGLTLHELDVAGLDQSQANAKIAAQICHRHPFIVRGLDFGNCRNLWTHEYLRSKLNDKFVTVHRSNHKKLDFIAKNFKYEKVPFCVLLDLCTQRLDTIEKEYVYLRAISEENGRSQVAELSKDFPEICADFQTPTFIRVDQLFSSILRVTSPELQLWTHYDVMDNVLCQIKGSKQVTLFPPSDVPHLYITGDKSRVLDVKNPDLTQYPKFLKATKYCGILKEGDALFIPALWFHNTVANSFSIAVNVFWKNLDAQLYSPKDLYGNKDLLPACAAFDGLNKALSRLKPLPQKYRHFFQLMMIEKINNEMLKQ